AYLRGEEDRRCRRSLSGEAIAGLKLGNAQTHSLHNPPSAHERPGGDRCLRGKNHPGRDVEIAVQMSCGEEKHGDDSHCLLRVVGAVTETVRRAKDNGNHRSEEHTSELQSRGHLVCRLLLEKKKKKIKKSI